MNDERMQRRVLEVGEPSNSNGLAMVLMKEKTATNNRQGKKSKANGARPGERRRRWKRRWMVACPALGNEMSTSPPANGAVQGPLPGAHWPRRKAFRRQGANHDPPGAGANGAPAGHGPISVAVPLARGHSGL